MDIVKYMEPEQIVVLAQEGIIDESTLYYLTTVHFPWMDPKEGYEQGMRALTGRARSDIQLQYDAHFLPLIEKKLRRFFSLTSPHASELARGIIHHPEQLVRLMAGDVSQEVKEEAMVAYRVQRGELV